MCDQIFIKKIWKYYNKMSIVAKATIWFMVCSFIQKGISFITTPVFTRLLTKEQYGLYSVYMSWLQILTIFTTFRLDYSVFNKGMSKYPKDRDGYASSMLGLTTCLTSILLILYFFFRNWINEFTELNTVIILGMFLELYVLPAISFWSLRERYEFHYKSVVLATLLVSVFNAVFGVIAVLASEDKGVARVLSCVLAQFCVGIVIYVRLMLKGHKFICKDYWEFAVLFNIPLIPHYFSTYIVEQSDKIMIQKMISMSASALYSVAYAVGGIVKIFSSSVANTLIPLQYRLLEKKDYKKLNKQICYIMTLVAGLVFVFSCIGPEIIMILGGREYMSAVYVMPPVAVSVFFSFLYTLLANIEFYFEKNKFAMIISFIGAALNVVLNFFFLPIFGYVAAAYTTLLSYAVYAVGHLIYVNAVAKKEVGTHIINGRGLLTIGIGSLIVSVLISILYNYSMVRYFIVIFIISICLTKRKTLICILKSAEDNQYSEK